MQCVCLMHLTMLISVVQSEEERDNAAHALRSVSLHGQQGALWRHPSQQELHNTPGCQEGPAANHPAAGETPHKFTL